MREKPHIFFFSTKVFFNTSIGSQVNLASALYQQYTWCLIIVGFILLIALVGAIMLVKFQKLDTKIQQIYLQTKRDLEL